MLLQKPPHPFQKLQAADPLIGRIRVRKMLSDIPQRGRAQKRIHHRMQQHVRIRMPQKPFFIWNFHAADDQLPVPHQTVHVISCSDPHIYLHAQAFCSETRMPDLFPAFRPLFPVLL